MKYGTALSWHRYSQKEAPEYYNASIATLLSDVRKWVPEERCAGEKEGGKEVRGWWCSRDVQTFEPAGGACRAVLKKHAEQVNAVCFSPDSQRLASGADDFSVLIFRVDTAELETALEGHSKPVNAVAFAPDGITVVSGSFDKQVRVWNVETGECSVLEGHEDSVTSVAFNKELVVSASRDTLIKIWDVQTKKLLRTLEGHEDYVTCVAFNSDGSKLVSGSEDQSLRVWEVATGKKKIMTR